MTEYRRAQVPGGTFFFTVNLAKRRDNDLLVREIGLLRAAVRSAQQRHPFAIVAAVVLPDHLHMIWRLPAGDDAYSLRWSRIKSEFSRALPCAEARSASRAGKRERGIWQRRYWEHVIRDDEDLRHHVEYIHYNPVKHGHADSAGAWPHSSFRRYVRAGTYAADWAAADDIRRIERD